MEKREKRPGLSATGYSLFALSFPFSSMGEGRPLSFPSPRVPVAGGPVALQMQWGKATGDGEGRVFIS